MWPCPEPISHQGLEEATGLIVTWTLLLGPGAPGPPLLPLLTGRTCRHRPRDEFLSTQLFCVPVCMWRAQPSRLYQQRECLLSTVEE